MCAGFTQGFAMVCRTLHGRGVERIAVEDPGFSGHRLTAEHCGLAVEPIAVDERGIDVSELRRSGREVVVVTAAHQFPTGVVLSSERRAALLEWAEDEDGLIGEDDYDSELRYGRDPVGALQGLSPERVCHLGSLSKRLLPGLRLGWILSPSWLTGALTYEQGIAIGARPRSTSSRWPTSSPVVSSIGTCAGCGSSIAGGARRCSVRWPRRSRARP